MNKNIITKLYGLVDKMVKYNNSMKQRDVMYKGNKLRNTR
jgi:hypothetical protein